MIWEGQNFNFHRTRGCGYQKSTLWSYGLRRDSEDQARSRKVGPQKVKQAGRKGRKKEKGKERKKEKGKEGKKKSDLIAFYSKIKGF